LHFIVMTISRSATHHEGAGSFPGMRTLAAPQRSQAPFDPEAVERSRWYP
jgi:hypothetical protein